MKKLFVGNLSWKSSEDDLRNLFSKFGGVASVRIIVDQYTGKSKGFGFVEMEDADGATKAIAELNETPFMDRNIRVSAALERQERAPGSGPRGDRPDRGGPRGDRGGDRGDRGDRPSRGFRDREESRR